MAAVRFDACELDLDRYELRRDGQPVALEPRAMQILIELIDHRDRVVAKIELLDSVWGDRFVSESALTTQVKELRRAVGDTGREQRIVKTVHGRGYRFVADVHDDAAEATPARETAGRAQPVLAVLPFASLTAASGHEHVAAGLTHDIITALSKHRGLRVLAKATAADYADVPDAASRLHDDLNVDYVVEGTVRLTDRRLRVTASLTDARTGVFRWAERYDRTIEDLFDVLDEITYMIAATVEPEIGYAERERVRSRPPADLRMWDLYHLGIAHFFRFTAADNLEAQRLLARCRDLDPSFGDAHAWWAYAVVLGMVYWDTEPDPETLDAALSATHRALELDDHNAVFHMLRGRVQLARREYASALAENRRAVELNPTFAAAFCGLGDSLCYEGRYDEAIEQFAPLGRARRPRPAAVGVPVLRRPRPAVRRTVRRGARVGRPGGRAAQLPVLDPGPPGRRPDAPRPHRRRRRRGPRAAGRVSRVLGGVRPRQALLSQAPRAARPVPRGARRGRPPGGVTSPEGQPDGSGPHTSPTSSP